MKTVLNNKLVALSFTMAVVGISQGSRADTASISKVEAVIKGVSVPPGAAEELFTALEKGGAERDLDTVLPIANQYKTQDGAIQGSISATRLSQYVITFKDPKGFSVNKTQGELHVGGTVARQLFHLMEKAGFAKTTTSFSNAVSGDFVNCSSQRAFVESIATCTVSGLSIGE